MIVLGCVVDLEYHCNLRVKIFDIELGEVMLGIKHEAVSAAGKRFFNQKERLHPAVFISPGVTQLGPGLIRVLDVQVDRDAAGRSAARDVEYVR